MAGFLAYRDYMNIQTVILVAFCGSYAGDSSGTSSAGATGASCWRANPKWEAAGEKALAHIRRHPDLWVLSFRFVYGLRTVMPVAIGLSGYPPARYLILNGIVQSSGPRCWVMPPITSAPSSKGVLGQSQAV